MDYEHAISAIVDGMPEFTGTSNYGFEWQLRYANGKLTGELRSHTNLANRTVALNLTRTEDRTVFFEAGRLRAWLCLSNAGVMRLGLWEVDDNEKVCMLARGPCFFRDIIYGTPGTLVDEALPPAFSPDSDHDQNLVIRLPHTK